MAGRFAEGFDQMATADLVSRFSSSATPTIGANGRNSGNSARLSNVNGFVLVLTAKQTWIIGSAYKFITSFPGTSSVIFEALDGAVIHLTLRVNSIGNLLVYRGTGTTNLLATSTTALSANTFYYIELRFKIDDSAGELGMQINGVAETLIFGTGTSTTQDTRNAGNATCDNFHWGADGASAHSWEIDDMYVLDGDSADVDNPNNTFLGDCRVEGRVVSGAGDDADFTPSASTNASNVDDSTPDGDSTYNSSSTLNHTDTFAMTDLATTSGSVAFVELCNYARKADAGSAAIAAVLKPGSTKYVGTDRAPSVGYRYHTSIWDVNPDTGLAFTVSEINATKAGYKKTG